MELEWKKIKSASIETFQLGDEPELIHIIRTGFAEPIYHVVEEDVWELFDRSVTMTKDQIERKYNIEITI